MNAAMSRWAGVAAWVMVLSAAAVCVAQETSEDTDSPSALRDWPAWRGMDGSGSAGDCGEPTITDLSKAAMWESADRILPTHAGVHGNKGKIGGVQSSLVAADGLVFYYSSHAAEDPLVMVENPREPPANNRYHPDMAPELWKRLKNNVAGDDVVMAFDAKTGKTAWKQVLTGRGINFNGWNYGPHLTPCYADGKLYVVGSTKRIYCLDGKTGDLLWERADLPPAKKAAERREQLLADRKMIFQNRGGFEVLSVADGVVYAHGYGLDGATGKTLWEPEGNRKNYHDFPLVWRYKDPKTGKTAEYFICGDTCIDPKTGREMWSADGSGTATPILSGNKLILRGSSAKRGEPQGINGWRISPDGAEKMWETDPKYRSVSHSTPVAHRGRLYSFFGVGPGQSGTNLACVDLETGKVLAELPCNGVYGSCKTSSFVATDGFVLYRGPDKHGKGHLCVVNADPKDFKHLGTINPPSFDTAATPAVVDGVIYLRGVERVYAIDLKQQPSITPSDLKGPFLNTEGMPESNE